MHSHRSQLLLLCLLISATVVTAANIAGQWSAQIETQIGLQKYLYEFKSSGDAITGIATFERTIGNGSVVLRDIKLSGENLSFTEPFVFDGNEIPINYSGKVTGDMIKFSRNVGEFATEQFVANRVIPPATEPAEAK